MLQKSAKILPKNILKRNLFYLIVRICLQHFLHECLKKIYFHTLLGPDPKEFKISGNACIWKVSFALKTHIRFRATELRQKIKFDVFRKPLFCNLARTRNLVPDAVPNAARQYLQRDFTFSTTKWSFLEFQRSKKLKRKFSDNIEQNIWRPFHQPGR